MDTNSGVTAENETAKKQKHERIILIIVLILAILGLIIAAVVGLTRQNNESETGHDDVYVPEEDPTRSYAVNRNMDFLEDMVSPSCRTEFFSMMNEIAISPTEVLNQEPTVYTVFTQGSSVSQEVQFPYSVLVFTPQVSDGRIYMARIATNAKEYCGILLRRTSPSEGEVYLTIVVPDGEVGDDRDSTVKGLIDWAKGNYNTSMIINTKN